MPNGGELSDALRELCSRVRATVAAFGTGGLVLVGDDGQRENEADLVFHAKFATAQAVNAAITHARGLLCVSVDHTTADHLGFLTAPRIPGDISHTGFTLSVDAAKGVGSGISASDRGVCIRAMVEPGATNADFVSPGHVFPVRAHRSGLLARTGHTEALQELCGLANLPGAAAMCEVLGPDGEALKPKVLVEGNAGEADPSGQLAFLRALPYVSTVDLLWYRVFYSDNQPAKTKGRWKPSCHGENETVEQNQGHEKTSNLIWQAQEEEHVTCDGRILLRSPLPTLKQNPLGPDEIRVSLSDGFESRVAGSPSPRAELRFFVKDHAFEELNPDVEKFCDLSRKEGLASTQVAVRRTVTLLRALAFLESEGALKLGMQKTLIEMIQKGSLPVASDSVLLQAWIAGL